MSKHSFDSEVLIPDSGPSEVFDWHARPGSINRLLPPWQDVTLLRRTGKGLEVGAEVLLELKFGPFTKEWLARHTLCRDGEIFVDEQVRGPFHSWRHEHRFLKASSSSTQTSQSACLLHDRIDYELPLGALGDALGASYAEANLRETFAYRHRVLSQDLAWKFRLQSEPKHFMISGASGLVGSQLAAFLTAMGHRVSRLVRRKTEKADEVFWNPLSGEVDSVKLAEADVIVHLAGENIAAGRWTEALKKSIRDSRILSTRTLVGALSNMRGTSKERVFICASAIGYYGNRGDLRLDEDTPVGGGFLSEVCRDWEEETRPLESCGIRSANLRIGMVLSPQGGALRKMLTPFKLGLGGALGSGKQWMSWISLDDLIYGIVFCALTPQVSGPVNMTSPEPLRSEDFTRILAGVLSRPVGPRVPEAVLKLMAGELAEQLLLASIRVEPRKLKEAGFVYAYPSLEKTLRHLLGLTLASPAS